MQAKLQEQLSPADAEVILERLPERIRVALIARAAEIEYPLKPLLRWRSPAFWIRKRWVLQIVNQDADSRVVSRS